MTTSFLPPSVRRFAPRSAWSRPATSRHPLRVGVALLSLLSGIATEAPLLLVVDDAQWVDSASLDALAFVIRRATEEPIVLLAGGRAVTFPRGRWPRMPRLVLEPLTARSSARTARHLADSLCVGPTVRW